MTSPLLKKHPIIRRSTLRTVCGSLTFRVAAGLAIVVIAALTAWSAEPGRARIDAMAAEKAASNSVEFLEAPGAETERPAQTAVTAKPRRRVAKTEAGSAAPAASGSRRKPYRGGVVRTSFQPGLNAIPDNEANRQFDPSGNQNFQRPLGPVPEQGAGEPVRPFRKIADIVPYDNYEPDPELAAKDPCANLCPRPLGADCPDCAKDGDGNTIPCPDCPFEQELRRIGRAPGEPDRQFEPRNFAHIHYCWEPTNLYHNPIYFEDVDLERYGHTRNYLVQPVFSLLKFGGQLVGLPYQMSIYPMWDRQYSLGYYRPGEWVPYKYCQVPWNAKAAVVEAGVITGSYFLFAPGVGP
jgi:hypothetical protein